MTLASCESGAAQSGAKAASVGGSSMVGVFSRMMGLMGPENSIRSDGKDFTLDSLNAVKVESGAADAERLPVVGDRETLLKLLLDRGVFYDNAGWDYGYYTVDEAEINMYDRKEMAGGETGSMPAPSPSAAPPPAMDAEAPMAMPGGGDHSETNEQVEGVSEGDIVKTDGRYIYAMSPNGNILRLIKADGAKLEVVSTIWTDI